MKKYLLLSAFVTAFLLSACSQVTEEQQPKNEDTSMDTTNSEDVLVDSQLNQEDWSSIVAYNCELSDGEFTNNTCSCPYEAELGQNSKTKYDLSTGFCSSDIGGPAGDAFNASIGLPYGSYDFWTDIVGSACTESGGDWMTARCTCPSGTSYDKSTGVCK